MAVEPRFEVPDDIYQAWDARERGAAAEAAWNERFAAYRAEYPAEAAELERRMAGELPADFDAKAWEFIRAVDAKGETIATRKASQNALNGFGPMLPEFLGGSADLAGSNLTLWKGCKGVSPEDAAGNYVYYGVREFGMSHIMNGMALHGGVIPYGGTFLVFSDYMRGSMRLSALMGVPVVYVLTHDSIGLGEDGPTHQPIEHLAALRAIPNMTVIRPADANEVSVAWKIALTNSGPTVLALTRQNLPVYDRTAEGMGGAEGVARGGYVMYEAAPDGVQVALIATGSEVEIAFNAAKQLAGEGIGVRVVNLASWELFAAQDAAYRAEVLPPDVPKLAIEAGVTFGWERWVGNDPRKGAVMGIDRFGASAPYKRVYAEFGLTPEAAVAKAKTLIQG